MSHVDKCSGPRLSSRYLHSRLLLVVWKMQTNFAGDECLCPNKMGIDDLFGFDEEKYSQSLHSKYPTVAALQANEKKKSEQIAAATGGTAASYAAGFVVGPVALIGVGLSGRNLSIATQKRDLIRKALKDRYDVEKTSMTDKTFFKNAGLAVGVKALTLGAAHGVEHFCVSAIPPGIDAAPHGFGATEAAIAHPEHCLEGIKGGMMSELHAVHTLATTGSPDAAAQQLAYGPAGDNAYLAGTVIGDHAARGAEKSVAKLAIKGGSKLVSSRLNNPTTPRSKPTTPKSTAKPTIAPTAAKAQENKRRRTDDEETAEWMSEEEKPERIMADEHNPQVTSVEEETDETETEESMKLLAKEQNDPFLALWEFAVQKTKGANAA